jgi:SHS2 domain-containing protein
VNFFEKNKIVENFQKELFEFFQKKHFPLKQDNKYLPHVTICRNHFDQKIWEKSFRLLPLYIKSFNLYESLGHSEYNTLWKKDFIRPFEEIKHTADIAFIVKGKTYQDLLYNSFIALSFKSLDFLLYHEVLERVDSIDDVIINLNNVITKAEIDGIHIPFKAVSFHSHIEKKDNILLWEMIVDV